MSTPGRRRKNIEGLRDALGVPPGVREGAVEDLRGGLSPRSPGLGARSAPVLPPAPENTDEARAERERERRRKWTREVLLGRGDAGSRGDVDAPDAAVGEEWAADRDAVVRRSLDVLRDPSSSRLDCEEAADRLVRLEVAEGVATPKDARAALDALHGPSGLSEAGPGTPGSRARVAAAERLREAVERRCGCGCDGDPEDRGGGCGALCAMADRQLARHRDAGRTSAMREFLIESGDVAA